MKEYLKWILGFGFLIWLIPFLVSFPIIDLRESNRVLFESIMPVVLTITILLFTFIFFRKVKQDYLKEGIYVGIIWFIMSIGIDLALFLPDSPMQMSLSEYFMDIGIIYLIIILIPFFVGLLIEKKLKLLL